MRAALFLDLSYPLTELATAVKTARRPFFNVTLFKEPAGLFPTLVLFVTTTTPVDRLIDRFIDDDPRYQRRNKQTPYAGVGKLKLF